MTRWRACLYVIIGAVCYGALSTLVKIVLQQGFSIQDISSGSIVLGCLMIWMITLPVVKEIKKYAWKTILIVVVVGSVWGLTEIFYMLTLDNLPASLAVVLLFQFAWMTQIIDMIQSKKWLSKERWIALTMILIGTYFASGTDLNHLLQANIVGVIFGLLSALSYAASVYISESVGAHMNQLLRSSLMLTGQMVFVLLVFSPTFSFVHALAEGLWPWALFLGFVGFVITTYTYNKAIPHIGTSLAGVLGTIELPTVILFSTLLLKETVTLWQWVGIILILLGIIVSEYSGFPLAGKFKTTRK